ncbi:16S rRNA (guanine(966)-N(2))-methyltransferase RsmD [Zobellella maritima]|uniref:16S rRNA (guanine(966)-N(2))-methyltransferase RsmD n=1 Tax=Zobellella maritima TaxID=2059725 RepID=UPI000E30389E|nr:16S rRNA (guanine(966)-N(2))-methyltransferase RsmD [Zobellella maritima]
MVKAKQVKKPSADVGQIRLIGGQWRGRKLPVLNSKGLRPTSDRVKETLFNWLMFDIRGTVCLDLFAGSGSLGFEALSRGAKRLVMVEKEVRIARQLELNLASLSGAEGKVVNSDAQTYLTGSPESFDLVFLDPPFHQDLLSQVCTRLEQDGWLAPEAMIYIEREQTSNEPSLPGNWRRLKDKRAGQVCYQLYQREQNK